MTSASRKVWPLDESWAMRRKREELRTGTRAEAESVMRLAGFTFEHVWELANQYWPDNPEYDDVRDPWWLFLTEIGPVQIGWRKRVLHIDWSATNVRAVVTVDEVSKSDRYVHAWSTEKAVEYLKSLRRAARATRSPCADSGDGTCGVEHSRAATECTFKRGGA